MIVKQLMYKNKVDKVFDNVFVTFFKSTNKQNVQLLHIFYVFAHSFNI